MDDNFCRFVNSIQFMGMQNHMKKIILILSAVGTSNVKQKLMPARTWLLLLFIVSTASAASLEEMGAEIRARDRENQENPKTANAIQDAGIREYFTCITRLFPYLDDGQSDATTIATGAQAACRSHLAEATSRTGGNAANLGAALHPYVISQVLKFRSQTKKPASTKKTNPLTGPIS